MRKILFSALLIALSVFVLFGCGGDKPVVTEPSQTDPPATNAPAVTDPPVTNAPVVTEAVKAVEEYPDYASKIEVIGDSEKDALAYKLGDEISFSFTLKYNSTETVGCREFRYKVMADGAKEYSGKASGSTGKFELTIPSDYVKEPGTAMVSVTAIGAKGAILCSCTAGVVVNMDEISAIAPIPTDFEEFWKGCLEELLTVDPTSTTVASGKHESNYFHYYKMDERYMQNSINCKEMIPYLGSYDFYEVFLAAPGDKPAVFYIAIPKELTKDSYPISMILNHYDPRNALISKDPNMIAVSVGPCGMPGVYYDEKTDTYTKASYGAEAGFLNRGYDNPETAYVTYMLKRNVQVLRFLSNPEYTKGTPFEAVTALYNGEINFSGGSMGGFQSVATATLVKLFADLGEDVGTPKKLTITAPGLSDITSRAGETNRISGNSTLTPNPNLPYFDTAHFVTFLDTQEIVLTAGFADMTCPPSGFVVLYNAAKCKISFEMTQNRGHLGDYPKTIIQYTRAK